MKFNARLPASIGIILLLLVPPAYSQGCDSVYRYGNAQYYFGTGEQTYYGVNAKNELHNLDIVQKVTNSIVIKRYPIDQVGYYKIGWVQTPTDKKFFVAWKTTSGDYNINYFPASEGKYWLWAYNNAFAYITGCICKLDSNGNHESCLYSSEISKTTLGFDKGRLFAQGETFSNCDVSSGDRFARFWDLGYNNAPTSNPGQSFYYWNYYNASFNDPLNIKHEFDVYKKEELS